MLFLFISFMLNAIALDIVFMDYTDIDHEEPETCTYYEDGCNCECKGY
jgi:hypothetical protein